jgi:NAD(P)-dependent dehydrogenase (short-subunit alcohol dehydrogenase family)
MVFGAGPNIGGTIAHFLAREGARTVVCDIDESAAAETVAFLEAKGLVATALQGDAAQEGDVERAVAETSDRYGAPDIIVNMAGKIHWSSVVNMELEGWLSCLTSFPTAAMLTTKHAARAMIAANKGGSIIHLLSTAAHFGEASGAAYTAAKAAVLNFARSAAMDLAHDRIRVNTISPCAMEHNLWGRMQEEILDPDFKRPGVGGGFPGIR